METAGRGSRVPCWREGILSLRRLSPSCSRRRLHTGSPRGWQIHAARAGRISSRHGAAANVRGSIRQRASALPWCRYLLFSAASECRLISLDRFGRNRTTSCPALLPFPSSFAIPVRTRASACGMPTANFAAAVVGQALALASRLARRELPGPRANQLSRAPRPNPLDVPEAAAP
jgi:hypothetical protein